MNARINEKKERKTGKQKMKKGSILGDEMNYIAIN